MNDLDLMDPFKRMRRMEKFDRFFDNDWFPASIKMPTIHAREPLLGLRDAGKALEIKAELPGIDKKDLNIELDERRLSLSAKVKAEREEKDKEYYYKERKFQSFYRSIALPTKINPHKVQAEFKNGILKLTLPKESPAKRKTKAKTKSEKFELK